MRRNKQPEKFEQQLTVEYLRWVGSTIYIVGTRRPKGRNCPKCGTFVAEHQGTCQTPGQPDIWAFVPNRQRTTRQLVAIECKAPHERRTPESRMSDAQTEFRDLCVAAGIPHIVGGLNEVIAWLLNEGIVDPKHVPHYRLPKELR